MRSGWRAGALAPMMAALAIGACGGGTGTNTGTKTAPPPTAVDKNQINPHPLSDLQEGGTFTWPIEMMPANFNANQIDGTERDNNDIMSALMPWAYVADAQGTPTWNHDVLASEPTLVTSPKQVVTFEINPKAQWDDGTPITWQDFYWQWKANSGANKAYRIASANGFEEIESIARGSNDREVVVTFKRPYADWQAIFAPIFPASTNKDPKIFNEGWIDHPLLTAGPFKLGSIDHTSKTITLLRNDKWWGTPPVLDRIVFRQIDPDAQIDAIANGEIDAMEIGADPNKYVRARSVAGAELRSAGGPNFRHVTINGTGPILQDVRVRQALAMGIDRAAIAKALIGPLGINAQALNNHIFMTNQAGYQDNSGDVGKYNPARAGELLDQAGWKLSGKTRTKDGKALTIRCIIPGGVATSRQESELIQNMLGQIGITVMIDTVPSGDFFSKYITPGQFDITVFSWIGTPYPISSNKSIYVKPVANAKGELDIQQNYARTGSDQIDQLFQQATSELDRQKAIGIANQVDALIWQEVHSLTLYQRPDIVLAKKNLANFGALGLQQPWPYQQIGWLKAK